MICPPVREIFHSLKLVVLLLVQVVLRARRNEKDLKVKPATSFKYFQYLLTKK